MHKKVLTINAYAVACLILMNAAPAVAHTYGKETTMTIPISLGSRLKSASAGDALSMEGCALTEDMPAIPCILTAGGPPLLFSDDPEYFRVPEGAAMRETAGPGVVRLYIYHVNGTTDTVRRIGAAVENLGRAPMKIRFLRYAFQGPSKNYHLVGKKGLAQFMASKPQRKARIVPMGGAVPLDEAMEAAPVRHDELVHGFYEVEIDQPARFTVVQTDPATPSPVAARRIAHSIPSNHTEGAGRGFFPFSDYQARVQQGFVLDTKNGPQQLLVADGKRDRWITGHDNSNPIPAQLAGNYGVMYRIRIPRASSDGRAMALITWNQNSDNSQWCGGLAAAMRIGPGVFPAGIVEIPGNRLNIGAPPTGSVIQIYPPLPPGCTETVELTFSPPGASCLPMLLQFVPIEK